MAHLAQKKTLNTQCWASPAKLNLFLYITGQRADGYHNLQTLFQFLDYGDTLTITPRADQQINLLTPIAGVANDDNLVIRAAKLLQDFCNRQQIDTAQFGADIHVTKILPMGGGLGGGSSNAATTLVALNHLWQARLSEDQLAQLGLTLGADVPVFVRGYAAFAQGVGEQLSPASPEEKWYLVAHPGVHISTPALFADPDLPRNTPERDLDTLLRAPFENDFETIARKRFVQVEQLLSWLLQYAPSRLTGSGACVFSEFNTETEAREVLKQAPAWLHGFVARGVNLSPLHQQLFERQA